MKTIITLLILFSTSYLFAQNIKIEIGDYPISLNEVMQQFESVKEGRIETKKGNTKYKVSQGGGSHGYFSTYENGSGSSTTSLHMHYVKGDRDKGNVLIKDQKNKDKKVAGFKVKTNGSAYATGLAFSANGKYALALGKEGDELLVYRYNLETDKLEIKGETIDYDMPFERIYAVGVSNDGKSVYFTDPFNRFMAIDIESRTGTTFFIKDYFSKNGRFDDNAAKYVFPSNSSNHVLIGSKKKQVLFDGKTGEALFIKSSDGSISTESFFVKADGRKMETDISGKTLSGPGIGVVIAGNSLMVFDQDQNYFATGLSDDDPEVLSYVSFDGQSKNPEPQPDLIPIISDVLSDKAKFQLYKRLSQIFFKKSIDSEELCHRVMESGEPHSKEFLLNLNLTKKGGDFIVRNHFVIPLVETINSATNIELTASGKEQNQKLLQLLKDYEYGVQFMEEDFKQPFIADKDAVLDAKNKLQAVSSDLYYMTVDELVEKGNQAVKTGASLSATAALLGIKFYEVAAMKEPNEPVHPCLIANAYANAEKFDKALENYNKALAMRPDYPLALFGIMKSSFMPVQKGLKELDDNLAKSIIGNADRFLAVAPADYKPEMTTAKRYKAFCQLYLDDKNLYAQYNLATGLQNTETRAHAVSGLLLSVEKTGNKYLAADMANIIGFDLINVAESKNHDKAEYLKADAMLAKSVKGGINDAQTYYNWAQININYLGRGDEGLRIIEEAKKLYPLDANFDALAINLYYNKGRELYLAKSYSKAIPYFEKYVFTAAKPILKAQDYLGFAYYRTRNYPKAAEHMQKLKDGEKWNTIQAHYPNFNALLAYAKNPSGTAPAIKDNTNGIIAAEDKYEKGIDMGGSEGLKLMLEAANYYDQINYDYGQGIAHSGVGVEYHRMGKKYEAKDHYKKCIDNGPQSSSCFNNLAMIYIDEKSLSSAKSTLDKGKSKFPNATDLKKTYAEYYIQMGFNEYGKKSYYSAITNFKNCISYNSGDAWAHMYLGYSYYATGKLNDAKTSLRKAVQLDPKLRNEYPAIGQILNQ